MYPSIYIFSYANVMRTHKTLKYFIYHHFFQNFKFIFVCKYKILVKNCIKDVAEQLTISITDFSSYKISAAIDHTAVYV